MSKNKHVQPAMTVGKDSVSWLIQDEFKRDVLAQLLSEKTTAKRRRELVASAKTSFPSHISRRLLLEEHKLDIRLEQIEKERRHFISKNKNEQYLLQLSIRSLGGKGPDCGQQKGENNAGNGCVKKIRYPPSHTIQRRHSEGNETMRKPSSPTTSAHIRNGPKSVNQLQVQKLRLSRKVAQERPRCKSSLSWKHDYVIPQVPPPSRSPSTTDLILGRIKSTLSGREEDLRKTKGPFPATSSVWDSKKRNSFCTTESKSHQEAIEDSASAGAPNAKQATQKRRVEYMETCKVTNGWTTPDNPNVEITIPKMEQSGEGTNDVVQKPTKKTRQEQAPESFISSPKDGTINEHFSPLVKGLNISRTIYYNLVRPTTKSNQLQPEDEKENGDVVQIKCSNENKPGENGLGHETIVQHEEDIGSSGTNIMVARDQMDSVCRMIRCPKICESTAASKPGNHCATGSSKKLSTRKAVNKIPLKRQYQRAKIVEQMSIQAKKITSSGQLKGAVELKRKACLLPKKSPKKEAKMKIVENRDVLSRNQSAKGMNSSDKFCTEKLHRKRCSACVEKFSGKLNNLNGVIQSGIRDKEYIDTNKASITDVAVELDDECTKSLKDEGSRSPLDQRKPGSKMKSPSPILLPTSSQIQGFNKDATRRVRRKIATKTRRHSYRAALGFQSKLSPDR